jgi:type IV secretory pathway TraG/TraD family ATPase VirD4
MIELDEKGETKIDHLLHKLYKFRWFYPSIVIFIISLIVSSALRANIIGAILVVSIIFGAIYILAFISQPKKPKKSAPNILSKGAEYAVTISIPKGVYSGDADAHTIRISTEDRGCVIGPPACGKTTFLISQLLDWAKSGRSFVVNDVKPEIHELARPHMEKLGYTLWVFNPTHPRHRYNLLDDLDTAEAVGELAAALCPNPDPADAVFNVSARDLLDAVIGHLRATQGAASLPAVRAYLAKFGEHHKLIRDLLESPSADVQASAQGLRYTAANERLIGSILAVLMANLSFLRYPAVRSALEASDFTLEALHQPRTGVFLQFEESARLTTAALWSVTLAHLLRHLIVHTNREPVLLLLDEIGTAPPVAGLVEKLNTIRSRKMPTWLYWQSLEQMRVYGGNGVDGRSLILGACDLQMVFRLNDNESAQWMSDRIGTVEWRLRSVTHDGGLFSGGTASDSLSTEPAVRPHELQRLGRGEVVTAYRHLVWKGRATPYYERGAAGSP